MGVFTEAMEGVEADIEQISKILKIASSPEGPQKHSDEEKSFVDQVLQTPSSQREQQKEKEGEGEEDAPLEDMAPIEPLQVLEEERSWRQQLRLRKRVYPKKKQKKKKLRRKWPI